MSKYQHAALENSTSTSLRNALEARSTRNHWLNRIGKPVLRDILANLGCGHPTRPRIEGLEAFLREWEEPLDGGVGWSLGGEVKHVFSRQPRMLRGRYCTVTDATEKPPVPGALMRELKEPKASCANPLGWGGAVSS
jgi:hypothetical protein